MPIKPALDADSDCHVCGNRVQPHGVLWQGIHVCAEYRCAKCAAEFLEDLPVGHATLAGFRVDSAHRLVRGEAGLDWLGEPLRRSLEQPDPSSARLEVRRHRGAERVVVLNCLDFLYGHCLLKLLNAQSHMRDPAWGLVVMAPRALAWMVPEGVAESWILDQPLSEAQRFLPDLHRRISAELGRFSEVRLSRAFSHPVDWNLERHTGVAAHDFFSPSFRVTFVERGDRQWLSEGHPLARLAGAGLPGPARATHRRRVLRLLEALRDEVPGARPTVAGFGREGSLPAWIDDCRLDSGGDAEAERKLCRTYAESRVVIGVHGSNMLLASGHAGMSIDLMPESRWSNIAQDILFAGHGTAQADPRLSAFRHRQLPVGSGPDLVARIAAGMIRQHDWAQARFVTELA